MICDACAKQQHTDCQWPGGGCTCQHKGAAPELTPEHTAEFEAAKARLLRQIRGTDP